MAGPLFVISLILVLSGALKAVSPDSAAIALSSLGVPVPDSGVRLLGGGEMALGVAGLLVAGSAIALLIGTAYLVFAAVAEVLRRREGDVGSCGCFGSSDTPPSVLHTAVNVVAAAFGFGAAIWAADDLLSVLESQPAAGVPFLALVGLGAYLMFLAFTALPRVFAPPVPDVQSFTIRSGAVVTDETDETVETDETDETDLTDETDERANS